MKQWLTYSILFCLLFLNAPRYLVHDCEHHHSVEANDDLDLHSDSDLHFEAEDCFACEFDLDIYQVPEIKVFGKIPFANYEIVEQPIAYVEFDGVLPRDYRGPPLS